MAKYGITDNIPSLDSIRGLAIVLVLMQHGLECCNRITPLSSPLLCLARFGSAGVTLFFVLSGFLITRILIRTSGEKSYLRNFYGRRFLRVFPIYYLCLLLIVAVPQVRAHTGTWLDKAFLFIFATNLRQVANGDWTYGPASHFWSLSVEEQFYLVLPLLMRGFTLRNVKIFCWCMLIVSPLVRLFANALNVSTCGTFVFTLSNVDALAAGCLIAFAQHSNSHVTKLTPRAAVIVSLVLLVTSYFLGETDSVVWSQSLWAIAFALFINAVLSGLGDDLLSSSKFYWLRITGKISYGIYIYHLFVLTAITSLLIHKFEYLPDTLRISVLAAGSLLATLAIASLSWHFIEAPALRLKDHWFAYPSSQSLSKK